jgi:hypothetical protein
MLKGANGYSAFISNLPPSILTHFRPSRALALPPRVSALYTQDLSKAVRIRARVAMLHAAPIHRFTGEAQSIFAASRAVAGCIKNHFCLEFSWMVLVRAALFSFGCHFSAVDGLQVC